MTPKEKKAFVARMKRAKAMHARNRSIAVKSGRIKKGTKLTNAQLKAYQTKIKYLDDQITYMKNKVKGDPSFTVNFAQAFMKTRKELTKLNKEMQKLKK